MKISLLLLASWLLCPALFSQTEKGASPIPSTVHPATSTPEVSGQAVTRAVVVGISNYQDDAIPDLQYADKDAKAFADFLRSPGGGNLPPENLKLLTNERATRAQVYKELDWLREESKEGDQAIIYFSGHGDVESRYRNQPGFLLCWDTPPKSYLAGAFKVADLSEVIIPTLSVDKKVRVLLITDACRAGKLAGNSINGTQATAAQLTEKFANETKILSCQPSEYSHEGEQWGGGRGAFSYHLVEGLTGLADQNQSLSVTLSEIDRYLEDNVTQEVAPATQIPMTIGDKAETLTRVDAQQLEDLRKHKAGQTNILSKLGQKGLEEDALEKADSATQALYAAFEKSLEETRLFEPPGNCADDYFNRLIREESIAALHKTLRRNFAATLQDEVQQALNALLADDPYESNNWRYNPVRYVQYPKYLERAINLLGEGHYMHNSLLSKKLYFDAYLLTSNQMDKEENPLRRDSLQQEAKRLLLEAVRLEDRAPWLYHALAALYINTYPSQTDSLLAYDQKAIDFAPTWLLPYLDIIYEYQLSQNDYAKGEEWLLKAVELNPQSYLLLERLAWFRQWQGRLDEAIELCQKMIALKPDLFNGYGTLARTYWILGEPLKMRQWGLKSMEITPGNYFTRDVVYSYFSTRQPEEAMKIAVPLLRADQGAGEWFEMGAYSTWFLQEAGQDDEALYHIRQLEALHSYPSMFVLAKVSEGIIQYRRGQKEKAEKILRRSLNIDAFKNPFYAIAYAWLGVIAAEKEKLAEAEQLFQKGISSYTGNRLDDFLAMEEAHYLYGRFLLSQNRQAEAEEQFLKANDWRYQNGCKGWFGLACLAAKKGSQSAALDFLEKALDRYYPVPQPILEEPLFKKIRKTKRFRELMKKHFPEQ